LFPSLRAYEPRALKADLVAGLLIVAIAIPSVWVAGGGHA
jgi:hypothetical protein